MSVIKGINKLIAAEVDPAVITKLEAGASLHLRHSNITFKIIEIEEELVVRAEQGKSAAGNYADRNRLVELTRELFGIIPTNLPIKVQPVPYKAAVIDVVTPQWINQHMHSFGININTFVQETGIDRSNFSAWINNLRPMSQIVKALIFQTVKLYALRDLIKHLDSVEGQFKQYYMNAYFDRDLINSIINSHINMQKYNVDIVEPDESGRIIINISRKS